jgi:hypothetical protein
MNITANKSYWEWNNNGCFNGGIKNYDYTSGTKQFMSFYPDVLQKNVFSGYSVSSGSSIFCMCVHRYLGCRFGFET